jgi:hypothetical protein
MSQWFDGTDDDEDAFSTRDWTPEFPSDVSNATELYHQPEDANSGDDPEPLFI